VKYRNTVPGIKWSILAFLLLKISRTSKTLITKISNVYNIVEYLNWVDNLDYRNELYPGAPKLFLTREKLWKILHKKLNNQKVAVFEFGVAYGYASNWWISRLQHSNFEWHGFDRFTGVPRPWRKLDKGEFDTGGKHPEINHASVFWHIGDVEKTFNSDLPCLKEVNRKLILFDLDIFEPSLFAWKVIEPFLRSGDILYFDEAYDSDERKLLVNHVFSGKKNDYRILGVTPLALAIEIK
jgi:hypothetical protein